MWLRRGGVAMARARARARPARGRARARGAVLRCGGRRARRTRLRRHRRRRSDGPRSRRRRSACRGCGPAPGPSRSPGSSSSSPSTGTYCTPVPRPTRGWCSRPCTRVVELLPLDLDRPAGEEVVAAAVVEVQVGVDDEGTDARRLASPPGTQERLLDQVFSLLERPQQPATVHMQLAAVRLDPGTEGLPVERSGVSTVVAVAFGCPFPGEVALEKVARVMAEAAEAEVD